MRSSPSSSGLTRGRPTPLAAKGMVQAALVVSGWSAAGTVEVGRGLTVADGCGAAGGATAGVRVPSSVKRRVAGTGNGRWRRRRERGRSSSVEARSLLDGGGGSLAGGAASGVGIGRDSVVMVGVALGTGGGWRGRSGGEAVSTDRGVEGVSVDEGCAGVSGGGDPSSDCPVETNWLLPGRMAALRSNTC